MVFIYIRNQGSREALGNQSCPAMKSGTDLHTHTHMDEAEIPAEHLATDLDYCMGRSAWDEVRVSGFWF